MTGRFPSCVLVEIKRRELEMSRTQERSCGPRRRQPIRAEGNRLDSQPSHGPGMNDVVLAADDPAIFVGLRCRASSFDLLPGATEGSIEGIPSGCRCE